MSKILFINGSPNKNGNTATLAKNLLKDKEYETLNLTDYKIYSFGQDFDDDQFEEVIDKMKNADIIVLGSPLYWHNLSGIIRNLLDRFYMYIDYDSFNSQLIFLLQGASPQKWMLESSEYTVSRFASLYGFNYLGVATNNKEVKLLRDKL